jgi:hypothetical protein
MRPELIEAAIQRYYREHPVELSAAEVEKRTKAIEGLVAVSQQAVIQGRQIKTQLIEKLTAEQRRLIRLHAEEGDEVSPEAFREERARMQQEIKAAQQSLAETEQRLSLDADMLRMALELAEDVAAVYAVADEQLKRACNQAFFVKLYVTPEWDERESETMVRVIRAELTEPYALLLDENLVAEAAQGARLIQMAAQNAENGSGEPLSV